MTDLQKETDAYVKEKYNIEPEILPFSHEDYAVYRHPDTGRWFAVFIVKERKEFGLAGDGEVKIVSFRIRDKMMADILLQQPGYLSGYPARNWNWISVVTDGTVPAGDLCRWIDESYEATRGKASNKKTPLPKQNRKRDKPSAES